jgi:8-oxo-dGTP diphosphatase
MSTAVPYKIAVLVYVFNDAGELLLLRRSRPPNQDRFSPIGGKLEQHLGESPYACALREIHEEIGVPLTLADIRLLGIVSERAFQGPATSGGGAQAHWLMFCFEVTRPLNFPARAIDEGQLEWHAPDAVASLNIPQTDSQVIWPLVRKHASMLHRNGSGGAHIDDVFSVFIDCTDHDNFVVTHEHPRP